jgi:CHAD domain-containing protein
MKASAEAVQADTASYDAGPELVPQPLAEGPSAQQLALLELRRHLAAWMRHEPGARLGRDPEELHQLRVAARRIEATLGLFKHQLPSRLVHSRKGAKGVLRALGATRDFDVQLAELELYCGDLGRSEQAAAAPLRSRLAEERTRARGKMIGMLDSEATRHWLETLNLANVDSAGASAPPAPRAATVIPERVRGRFKKLKNAVRQLDSKSAMDEYHSVRRRAKQLRYAIESAAPLLGKPADEMLKVLRLMQDRLGASQDAHLANDRLAALATEGSRLPAETLFFMGRLAEHHLAKTKRARKTLARSWRKVRGKRWRSLSAKLQQLSDGASAVRGATSTAPHNQATPAPGAPTADELLQTVPAEARTLRH